MGQGPAIKDVTPPRASGLIVVTGADGRQFTAETVHCKHCGRHFIWPRTPQQKARFRRIRGWCTQCRGWICGPGCQRCLPTERRLEALEKGLSL